MPGEPPLHEPPFDDAPTPGTGPSPSGASTPKEPRQAAIEALLTLAATRDWPEISLADVAQGAGLTLSDLRGLFPSKGAILAAYSREIDKAVLDAADPTMAGEPARDRVFDLLMRRIDALTPHKAALERIALALRTDPLALAAMNQLVVTSMQWLLAAAAIDHDGPRGTLRAQGLAIAWARILRVWFEDDDPGVARTMTEVDRQLRDGEAWVRRGEELYRLAAPLRRLAERGLRHRPSLRERLREGFGGSMASGRGPEAL